MAAPHHILVFRFSALGDVAMTVPVIKLLLQQHPGLQVTFVSDPFMAPLFTGIERLNFYAADTKKKFKGLGGLYKLSRQLNRDVSYDAVADLHNVLRTKLLRLFLSGKPVAVINKGRKEKKELTRPINKKLRPLKTGFQRYADVFGKLGLNVVLDTQGGIVQHPYPVGGLLSWPIQGKTLIGIAPFAKHAAKMYPLDKMKQVVGLLAVKPGLEIVLLGSKAEAAVLKDWENIGPSVHSLAGQFSFTEELQIVSTLKLMLSMDSANMHLASMQGIPVVSVWGGTHPYLGFYGWGQAYENAVQQDLPCRPSSVFGNKDCPVHGAAGCMQAITPEMIVAKIMNLLGRVPT